MVVASTQPISKPLTGVPMPREASCNALAVKCQEFVRTQFSVKQRGGGFSLDLSHNRSLGKHRALIEWALPWSGFAEVVLLRTGRFASHPNLVAQDLCVDKTHHFPPLHEAATVRGCQTTGVCSTLSIYGTVARQFLAEWAIASSQKCCTCPSIINASETRVPSA